MKQHIQESNDDDLILLYLFIYLGFTCKLETPAALMTPNITRNIPPTTGSGMVVKMAATLPKIPIKTIKAPLVKITILLPTCQMNKYGFCTESSPV